MYFIDSPCLFITFHNNATRKFLQSTMLNLFEYIFIQAYIHFDFNTYSFECLERFSIFCRKDLRHELIFKENQIKNLAAFIVGVSKLFLFVIKKAL